MLDHNIYTSVEKLANEAPIPVFLKQREEYQLGGCGNVLKNLASLGCAKLYAFSVIGKDTNGQHIESILNKLDITNNLKIIDGYKTTTKQRFFCDNKIVFRCDTENTEKLAVSFETEIEELLRTKKIDCIIFSDYNKGVLYRNQCQTIINLANQYNVFTCVDPKNEYTKYIGCSLIKPNRREAYDIFKFDKSKSIEELHKHIFDVVKCKYSVITLAEKGITLYDGTNFMKEEPQIHTIIDVTGAGDIVTCILGYYFLTNTNKQDILKIATRIATKSIEYPGTYTIQKTDINASQGKHITVDQFKFLKEKHTQLVFTNGCFDLLHSGHIQLFKFCKEKGTVIVGLNSDDSICRLKGPTRPINNLETRLSILEAIHYIDYIVVFEDDTPYTIIRELAPDYLIKGGDYDVSTIIGREFAKQTMICNFLEDASSTNLIEKIKHPKKTVIHVWSQKICNQEVTETSWRFGIGDLIRGSIGMIQFCEKNNYDCIIDISLHPVSQFLQQRKHKYSSLIEQNKNNIQAIWPHDVYNHVTEELKNKDVIYFFTNFGLDVFDTPPSKKVIEKIGLVLTPSLEFNDYINQMMTKIPYPEFHIVHFRIGDSDLIQKNNNQDYSKYSSQLHAVLDKNQILLSDSERFKAIVKESASIFMFDEPVAHLGFHTEGEEIKHTLFEFLLLAKAKSICTFSAYHWTSGFVKIANYMYKVPII